jgi:hypothetical protein
MKTEIGNPAAFPVIGGDFPDDYAFNEGMSLRDYFAAKAMNALIVGSDSGWGIDRDGVSERAYEIADAMLKERVK